MKRREIKHNTKRPSWAITPMYTKPGYKRCTKCNKEYRVTNEYFYKDNSRSRDGFRAKCKKCIKKEYKENRYKGIANFMTRRTGETITGKELKAVKNREGGKCFYCGRNIHNKKLESFDHVIPVSKGGGNSLNNIVYACKYCNRSKSGDDPIEWYRMQIFYNKKIEKKIKNLISDSAS